MITFDFLIKCRVKVIRKRSCEFHRGSQQIELTFALRQWVHEVSMKLPFQDDWPPVMDCTEVCLRNVMNGVEITNLIQCILRDGDLGPRKF